MKLRELIEAYARTAAPARRTIAYNSEEHQRLYARFVRRTDPQEEKLGSAVAALFKRQKDAVLSKLKARAKRDDGSIAESPFDKAQWIRTFREEVRPLIRTIVKEAGAGALDDLNVALVFDVAEPRVVRFLEQRAQRFARQVNETTWDALKQSLKDGLDAGESMSELADRVEAVMAERIASSKETIARTEVIGAANGGTLEAWKQSDVVESKVWLAALDDRTRETHAEAHGQSVGLDEDFQVGDGSGPAPGQIGLAEEDINCRCSMTAELKA
jgi:SPP1 gp7 family putative phage head morphogenesis protein